MASGVQRVGRSGHEVGQVSRGTLIATHPRDLIEIAVLGRAVLGGDIERTRPVTGALDVLAQVLVCMVAPAPDQWTPDDLYDMVRRSYPYRDLPRPHFERVLDMLTGKYQQTRIRDLRPRLAADERTGTLALREGALQAVYSDGGTIPDRGYFHMRLADTRHKLGELDEEFVWENGPGSRFTFGNRVWRVERVTRNDVLVSPSGGSGAPPFWKAEEPARSWHFAERMGLFLEECDALLDSGGLREMLVGEHLLEPGAATRLQEHLVLQRAATGTPLPHRHHLVVEWVDAGPQGMPGSQVFIHAVWGRQVTRPFALALQAAWQREMGFTPEIYAANDGVSIVLPEGVEDVDPLGLVRAPEVPELLRQTLEASPYFGARFRECAARALLLARGAVGRRMPLWMSRLRAQELLDGVSQYPDFPIIAETWRTCCQDEFDLPALTRLLEEVAGGVVAVSRAFPQVASPFAQSELWRQVNRYMYAEEAQGSGPSHLDRSFLSEVVHDSRIRPAVDPDLASEHQARLQRTAPGYQPRSCRELVEWVGERTLVPAAEWRQLWQGAERAELDWAFLSERLVCVLPPEAEDPLVCTRATLVRLAEEFPWWPEVGVSELRADDFRVRPAARAPLEEAGIGLVSEWLRYYGPVSPLFAARTLGVPLAPLEEALDDLVESGDVIRGPLLQGQDDDLVCDARNFEALLRLGRLRAEVPAASLAPEALVVLMARRQGLVGRTSGLQGVGRSVERLSGLCLAADQWEAEVLPARVPDYAPAQLDQAFAEGRAAWRGAGPRRAALLWEGDEALVAPPVAGDGEPGPIPPGSGRFTFRDLRGMAGLPERELYAALWEAAWQGQLANDTFVALRAGVDSGFRLPEIGREGRHAGRAGRAQPRQLAGSWYRAEPPPPPADEVERLELDRERVRLLLGRYGILCRAVLARESEGLRWGDLFRCLRLMELSGELLTGEFIAGAGWPQFTTPRYLREAVASPGDQVFWLSAADPASPCGMGLPLSAELPARQAGSHLVFRGAELVLVSQRNGALLTVLRGAEDGRLSDYWAPLHHLLGRPCRPSRRIRVEGINDQPAHQSPYLTSLRQSFDVLVDHTEVILHRSKGRL
ncbi:MAG: ATP-dependent helicase [Candidatus Latescibacterota bacterium]